MRLTKTAPNIILDFGRRTTEVKDQGIIIIFVALDHEKYVILSETEIHVAGIPNFCIPELASKDTKRVSSTTLQAGIERPVYVRVIAEIAIASSRTLIAMVTRPLLIFKVASFPAVRNVATVGLLCEVDARNSIAFVLQLIVDGHENISCIWTRWAHRIRVGVFALVSQII